MYYYDFRMVDILIRVQSPFEIPQMFELVHFQVPYCPEREPDVLYQIRLLPEDWTVRGEVLFKQPQSAIYRAGEEYHRYYYWSVGSADRFVLLVYPAEGNDRRVLYLRRQDLDQLLPQFRLSAFFSMEHLLLWHHAFQLHASVVQWQGQGILFSAASGTGKSTQAELWRKYEDAQVINGDRGIIRLTGGQYRVYGSPYAGTSGIYTDLSAPVLAVVILSQAVENSVRRLSAVEAFHSIYREATVPAWDTAFVDEFSGQLTDLITDIPVLHLACRPDEEAVSVLKTALLEIINDRPG